MARGDPELTGRAAPAPAPCTLAGPRSAEYREQGSRFLATALPVTDETDARARVEQARAAHPDATHHCWAVRVAAREGTLERAHDAGEPAGTAGNPILQAIRGSGLTNVVVVVTRWFGGTKLGRGGLARAYRAAARAALDGAPRVESVPMAEVLVAAPVERDGAIRHLAARHGGRVEQAVYDDPRRARLRISVPLRARDALVTGLEEMSRDGVRIDRPPSSG